MCSRLPPKVARKGVLLVLGLVFLLPRPAEAQAPSGSSDEPPDPGEASEDETPASDPVAPDLRSVSIDDFGVPDEASFEPLWDADWDPNLTFTSPDCSLDLAGGARTEALGESFFFYAVLSVPLRGCRPPRPPFSPSMAPVSSPKLVRLTSFDPAEGSDAAPSGSQEGAKRVPPPVDINRTKEAALPSLPKGFLEEFRRRVLEGRGLSRSEERIDSLIRREKAAGILPELRLRGAHGFDQTLALASVGALPGESTTRDGSDLLVEARLTFRLQRFLVGDSEVSLERSRQTLLEKAYDSLEDALDQLLIFRRASVLALAPDATPEEKRDAELKAEGARIRLHVLTGGWFPLEGPLPGARKAPRD